MDARVRKVAGGQYEISLTLDGADGTHTEWALETLAGKDVATYLESWLPKALREEIDRVIAKHQRGCFS